MVYQNYHSNVAVEGVSKCDFAMSRDVACRVSMFAIAPKIPNINNLPQSDCRDAKFCVSTATLK